MSGDDSWRYYAALGASTVSTLSWLAAVALVGFAGWDLVTGQDTATTWLLTAGGAAVLGASFAVLERQLYTREGR